MRGRRRDPGGGVALGAYDICEAIRRPGEDYVLGEAATIVVKGRRMADPSLFFRFSPSLARPEVLPPPGRQAYTARAIPRGLG